MPEHPMLAGAIRNLGSEGRRETIRLLQNRLELAEAVRAAAREVVWGPITRVKRPWGARVEVEAEDYDKLEAALEASDA